MSFHGGLIGIITVSICLQKKNQNPFITLCSIISTNRNIFGRTVNFINSELYGMETISLGSKTIQIDNQADTQHNYMKQSLKDYIVLNINVFERKNLKKPGLISGLFLFFIQF